MITFGGRFFNKLMTKNWQKMIVDSINKHNRQSIWISQNAHFGSETKKLNEEKEEMATMADHKINVI